MKPHVEDAPGITWRQRSDGSWEAIWRARQDLIERGFRPKNYRLWQGIMPAETDAAMIYDKARSLQDEMLAFSRGGLPQANLFDGTIKGLIHCYETDKDSTHQKKRYRVRKSHEAIYKRIVAKHGHEDLRDIEGRDLLSWYNEWSDNGSKIAMGHAFIGHLRSLFAFGFTLLNDPECRRLKELLHTMKFKMPRARTEYLTVGQAIAVRNAARKRWPFIALAQAFQFECTLRQKDVIGEWVPLSEPGVSDTINKQGQKWIIGLRWEEIGRDLWLKHNTSKKGKDLEVNLRLAPMVMEELAWLFKTTPEKLTRDDLPASGPIILCEINGLPYREMEFRRKWRKVATLADIPKTVRNMDSRAGAITEAVEADVDLEHVRQAATHSNIATTLRYSRGRAAKRIAGAMEARVASRNKPKTGAE